MWMLLLACTADPEDTSKKPGPGAGDDTAAEADTSDPSGDTGDPAAVDWAAHCDAFLANAAPTFYETNPTYADDADHSGPWTAVSPEDAGVDGELLAEAGEVLQQRPFVLSFHVLKGEELVWEQYFHGEAAEDSKNVHSSSKSILGAVTGLAIDEGHLRRDTLVADLLPEHFSAAMGSEKADITVEHLLTMTAGFAWTEDVSEYQLQHEDDWLQAIVDLPLDTSPGFAFNYSTAQTHLLGAALTAASGESLCVLSHRLLFEPLGIAAEHWGSDPQGYFSGGCNVYLSPRELLRFGQLVLQDGRWEGEQLLGEGWVSSMLDEQVFTGGGYHYGYLWWMRELGGYPVKIAWGYGGQLIYVVEPLDLVMLVTTDTHDHDPDFDAEDVLESYVIPAL